MDCNAFYTLWAYDEDSQSFIEWGAMLSLIKQTLERDPYSELMFYTETSDVYLTISKFDFNLIKDLFAYEEDGVTKYALKLQVRAVVPGSTVQGADKGEGDLVTGEFMISLIEADTVEQCTGVDLRWNDVTQASGEERGDITYEIPATGEDANLFDVESLALLNVKPGCPVEIIAEVFEGYWDEEMGEWIGYWTDLRDNDYNDVTDMSDETMRSFTLEITQPQYIDTLSK
jgi:hypothetical protein